MSSGKWRSSCLGLSVLKESIDLDYFLISTHIHMYRKTSNISRTLVGNKIVDNSDVIGASPVGAAPTTSSLST